MKGKGHEHLFVAFFIRQTNSELLDLKREVGAL